MARPETMWPAVASMSAIARPLVSVSGVRVSLTVRTKQRIDRGAASLCSATDRIGACYHRAMHRPFDVAQGFSPAIAALKRCATFVALAVFAAGLLAASPTRPLDPAAARWVEQTLKKLTLDEKIGQLLVTSLNATFTSTDSDAYARLHRLVRDVKVGGILVFGATEALPALMLNPVYGVGGNAAR